MPQLDKEIFIEFFLFIVLILLYFNANNFIVENFIRLNTRFVYYQQLITDNQRFLYEISCFKNIVRKECQKFINHIF